MAQEQRILLIEQEGGFPTALALTRQPNKTLRTWQQHCGLEISIVGWCRGNAQMLASLREVLRERQYHDDWYVWKRHEVVQLARTKASISISLLPEPIRGLPGNVGRNQVDWASGAEASASPEEHEQLDAEERLWKEQIAGTAPLLDAWPSPRTPDHAMLRTFLAGKQGDAAINWAERVIERHGKGGADLDAEYQQALKDAGLRV